MVLFTSLGYFDLVTPFACLLVIALYHLHFALRLKKWPHSLSFGLGNNLRAAWIRYMIQSQSHILAVQTMRNLIMTASFFASTAVLLSLGTLSVAFNSPLDSLLDGSLFTLQRPELWELKWLLLSCDLFFAFFNFTLTIRHYSHTTFLINTPDTRIDCDTNQADCDLVIRSLNNGAFHNMLGMRGFYFSIPLVSWIISTDMLIVGTVLLLLGLLYLDHTI